MKKIKALLLTGYAIALLTGCKGDHTFKSIEIVDFPKTTFYCGEEFSNTGITLRVNFNDGDSFITEEFSTSNPSTKTPGTQAVKVYYTNDEFDVDTFVTYDINVIDWSKEEKAIFAETSLSSLSGVYYPKMEGMQLLLETDDETNEVLDYWIQKDDSSLKEIDEYTELLNNYCVTKTMSDSNGTYDVTFKFYESNVPSDFRDLYDEHDLVCYKYCASYKYLDPSTFYEYEFYANEIEDTIVIGLNNDGDMIIRFIADSIMLENYIQCEVNERLDMKGLYNGTLIEYFSQFLKGYVDEEAEGGPVRYTGYIDLLGSFAKDYFIFPENEPDVVAVANYASMYPWLHGEDDLAFELEICSDDAEAYEEFVSKLDAISDFEKSTRVDKIDRKDVNVTIYKIENKDFVGNLTIEVTDMIEDGMSFTEMQNTIKTTVTVDSYRVYYRWEAPEIKSPAELELFKIYDAYYGNGKYDSSDYDYYEDGAIGGLVTYTTKADDIHSKEEAMQKFVADYLQEYTVKSPAEEKQVGSITVSTATYANNSFEITIYTYYSGGKFAVEFEIAIARK